MMTSSGSSGPGPGDSNENKIAAEQRLAQLESQLDTYKKTLTNIYELYDKKIEELSLIRRIGDSIRTPLDLEALCLDVVDAVAREVHVDRLTLLLSEPGRDSLRVRASYEALEDRTRFYAGRKAGRIRWSGDIEEAAKQRRPLLSASADPSLEPFGRADGKPVSRLVLPLVAGDKTVGLFVLSRSEDQPFGDEDVRILTIISDQAATALANVRLFNDLAAANVKLQESEREARRTSLYLESLLETANDVIFTLDDKGIVTYVNRKAGDWGFTKEDLVGRAFVDLVADREGGADGDAFRWSVEDVEMVMLTGGGERRDVLLSASEIEGSAGPVRLVLARDVTQRKQLERQLFHSEKLASIGILAAGVAHEVGNPLSAISGYTQILQSGGATETEVKEYLEAIESQAVRIQRIIEDLLDYSRPSAGHRSLIDPGEAVVQVLNMLTAQRAFERVDVEYDISEDSPAVFMDRDHLAQVLVNMALNAVQAMEKGGRLTVTVRRSGGDLEIRLSDTGPGITPEIQGRIFDPFFTTKPAGRGTGLGLAICHRIVESYKGTMKVESEPGRGTTFIIRLPAAEEGAR